MYHSLNTTLAERIGVAPALVAQVLWDETDEGMWTETTFHKGRVWLKTSYTSLATIMPYLSYHQARVAVDKLVTLGIIQKISRIAKSPFDSTNWYSFTASGSLLMRATEQGLLVVEGDSDED